MPGIDELLRAEGERWRVEVDGHCPTTATAPTTAQRRWTLQSWRLPPRRILMWSASLAGAAASVTLLAALIVHAGSGTDESASSSRGHAGVAAGSVPGAATHGSAGGAASPAAPCDPVTFVVAPRQVAAGGRVTITGAHYGRSSCGPAPPGSQDEVAVRLTTADGRTVTLRPLSRLGADGSFRVRVTVPATAATGPATLSDGRGHRVRLLIQEAS